MWVTFHVFIILKYFPVGSGLDRDFVLSKTKEQSQSIPGAEGGFEFSSEMKKKTNEKNNQKELF